MKDTELVRKNLKLSGSSPKSSATRRRSPLKFVLCVAQDRGDLRRATLYRLIPDADARKDGLLRVIDDSGEDYLYPAEFFVPISVPSPIAARLFESDRGHSARR
jgi:hypothetical protein